MNDFINIFSSFFKFNYRKNISYELAITFIGLFAFITFIVLKYKDINIFLTLVYFPNANKQGLLDTIYYERLIYSCILTSFFTASVLSATNFILRYFKIISFDKRLYVHYFLTILRVYFIFLMVEYLVVQNISFKMAYDIDKQYTSLTELIIINHWFLYLCQLLFLIFISYTGLDLRNKSHSVKTIITLAIVIILSFFHIHDISSSDIELQKTISEGHFIMTALNDSKYYQININALSAYKDENLDCRNAYHNIKESNKYLQEDRMDLYKQSWQIIPKQLKQCSLEVIRKMNLNYFAPIKELSEKYIDINKYCRESYNLSNKGIVFANNYNQEGIDKLLPKLNEAFNYCNLSISKADIEQYYLKN